MDSYEQIIERYAQRIAELERAGNNDAWLREQHVEQLTRERDQARADAVALYRDGWTGERHAKEAVLDRVRAYAAGKPVTVYTREDLARAWDEGFDACTGAEAERDNLNPYRGDAQPVSSSVHEHVAFTVGSPGEPYLKSDAQPVRVEPDRERVSCGTCGRPGMVAYHVHRCDRGCGGEYWGPPLAEHDRAAKRKEGA